MSPVLSWLDLYQLGHHSADIYCSYSGFAFPQEDQKGAVEHVKGIDMVTEDNSCLKVE